MRKLRYIGYLSLAPFICDLGRNVLVAGQASQIEAGRCFIAGHQGCSDTHFCGEAFG